MKEFIRRNHNTVHNLNLMLAIGSAFAFTYTVWAIIPGLVALFIAILTIYINS